MQKTTLFTPYHLSIISMVVPFLLHFCIYFFYLLLNLFLSWIYGGRWNLLTLDVNEPTINKLTIFQLYHCDLFLLVGGRENHWPAGSIWQALIHKVIVSISLFRLELNSPHYVVMGIDCKGRSKSNWHTCVWSWSWQLLIGIRLPFTHSNWWFGLVYGV